MAETTKTLLIACSALHEIIQVWSIKRTEHVIEEFYAKFYAVLLHLNSQHGILKTNDIYEFQSVQQRKEVIGSLFISSRDLRSFSERLVISQVINLPVHYVGH